MSDKKILVIEDNELHRRLLNDILAASGYNVIEAMTGESAIKLAQDNRPDLVLLDGRLPDISGLEIARTLKATPATWSIPIIAVTAHAMPGDEQKLIESGCNAYLAKPINVRDLLVLVETFLSRPHPRGGGKGQTKGRVVELPHPNESRWPFRQKAAVVDGTRRGVLSIEEACERYRISLEEFAAWSKAFDERVARRARATRLPTSPEPPPRKRAGQDGE